MAKTSSGDTIKGLVTVGSFPVAILGGGLLAALLLTLLDYHGFPAGAGMFWLIFGLGFALTLFGGLPAIMFGLPAILLCCKLKLAPRLASIILAAGGAAVGALLMTITFTGFETPGAVTGGSIGLMLGVMVYPRIFSVLAARPIG